MRVVKGVHGVVRPPHRAVVTIGMFDGVHIAHQVLVRSTVRLAHRLRGTSVVVTFHPDPQTILEPSRVTPALMPLEERLRCLAELGVDCTWVMPFTRRFAQLSAEEFVRQVLVRRLAAKVLIVGENFAFGKGREGDIRSLQACGPQYGMRVVPLRLYRRHGQPISSSRIRQLVAKGYLRQAQRLLGRAPALYGVVIRGAGRGRQLGVPTANLRLIPQALPPCGVYVVCVRLARGRRTWLGVMNLGVRPTFGDGPLTCEVHLLQFSGALLGASVVVSLLARLRGERRFPSSAALIRQVRRDILHARRLFSS